jgi:hypothetical protein
MAHSLEAYGTSEMDWISLLNCVAFRLENEIGINSFRVLVL